MNSDLQQASADTGTQARIQAILSWLTLARGEMAGNIAEQALQHAVALRDAPLSGAQRLKLLDLLYGLAERIAIAEQPRLNNIKLPITRKMRQRIRFILELLAVLTQDYFNSLAALFDPANQAPKSLARNSLCRIMQGIAWQVSLTQRVASPPPQGIWIQLHAAFRTARRLGLENFPGPDGSASISRLYSATLLSAIAQPTSFSSRELAFIDDYIAACTQDIAFVEAPAPADHAIFWIDPERDVPANALIRRIPGPDRTILYFSCDTIAADALKHREILLKSPGGLAPLAAPEGAPGILQRLSQSWGNPAKRRFQRRRQSYRTHITSGLRNLWHLLKSEDGPVEVSEWMVTNESPDGFSLMHLSGQIGHLKVGDIVAFQANEEQPGERVSWYICIVRWALSENPEHIEIGLQVLAPEAISVELARPRERDAARLPALMLPAIPPLRESQALVVPSGLLREKANNLIVIREQGNLSIGEFQADRLCEQTGLIEVFSVSPEHSR